MTISTSGLPWPLSDKLVAILEEEMARFGIATSVGAILTFCGPDHATEADGLHTVEIAVGPGGCIEYISDLSCSDGLSRSEPVKELDFDFSLGVFQCQDARCLVPRCAGVRYNQLQREGLWAKYSMEAPGRQRLCVERYSIVKRA